MINLIIRIYEPTFNITFFHMIKNILFDSDCLKSLLVHNTTQTQWWEVVNTYIALQNYGSDVMSQ